MKNSIYLLLILALPAMATAQTTQKKTTTTKTTVTIKKKPAPAKKPAVAAKPKPKPSAAAPVARHLDFSIFVDNDILMLNGPFQKGKDYIALVADEKGNTLYSAGFNAVSTAQNVHLGKPLAAGTYHVTVHEKDNPLAKGTITLVRN